MDVTKELIDYILEKCKKQKPENEAEAIALCLKHYETCHRDRLAFDKQRKAAKEEYEKQLKRIDETEKIMQGACDHPARTFHADSSGNNDSWSECQICGAEIFRNSKQSGSYDG